MDTKFIFLLDEYLKRRGIVDLENESNAVLERSRGKVFSFEDHLRGLIYSLLTNQRKWSDVEPKLKDIDKLFFNYDKNLIKQHSAEYFEQGIRNLRCGNISIKKQMEQLHNNIAVLERIENTYGSLDAFVTSMPAEAVVDKISKYGSKYKLGCLGPALAWEYLRNVGIDGSKPDTHLKRFFGSERMGFSNSVEASDDEVIKAVELISKETGYTKFEVDYLIWCYCASGKGEVCTSSSHCNSCVIRKYCKH